jgi:hypothetical protein
MTRVVLLVYGESTGELLGCAHTLANGEMAAVFGSF